MAQALAAQAPPFQPDDFWLWRTVDEARIAPDGQTVAYAESWSDRAKDASFSNLWIVSADGRQKRRWTDGPWRDTSPRWSPDAARIAWLSDRNGIPQIYVRQLSEDNSTPLTKVSAPPLAFSWSPDGNSIAFTVRTPAEASPPAWAPASILPFLHRPVTGNTQIFIVPAREGGAPRRVTGGTFDYSGEPAWMPDGKTLLAVREGELVALPIDGGAARVLAKGSGRYASPLPSPDGARIAYLFADSKPQSYTIPHLFVMNADGSRVKPLAGTLDRDPSEPQWSSDSRTIYFLADDRGITRVYAARNDGTTREVQLPAARLQGFSLADNGRAVSVRSTATEPGNVVSFTVDVASKPVTLAASNEKLLAEREAGSAEEITYTSDGGAIQAWIVKPPRFDAARKYPLVLDIQDSPRAMCGVEFRLRARILAARGFVVLCANPRGTPGYGEQFGNLLPTRNPGDDFDDLMRGVDFTVSKGYIDPQRMAVTGGLLAAWTIGHTDRFHAAVARRPSSPIFFSQNLKTPTLVIAGEPDPESEALYLALQQTKVESALVRLPAGRPSAHVLEMEAILGWLGR